MINVKTVIGIKFFDIHPTYTYKSKSDVIRRQI